jgi:putative hydrolase of the HAD superfamily
MSFFKQTHSHLWSKTIQKDLNTFTHIKGIIWDLDNTLYRFNDAFIHACNIASGRAALKGGIDLSEEEAIALSQKSFDETGRSGTYFIEHHGLCQEKLHEDYHGLVDENLIHGTMEMIDLFGQSNLEHIIATHANVDWAQRALKRIGLDPYFSDDRIIGNETANFENKDDSPRAFEICLERLNLDAPHVMMVEDTVQNLRVAHDMGLTTIYLHHGRAADDLPPYVDVAIDNAQTLMHHIAQI